jgi:hypothetical protein
VANRKFTCRYAWNPDLQIPALSPSLGRAEQPAPPHNGDRAPCRHLHIPRASGSTAQRNQLAPIREDDILGHAHVNPEWSTLPSPRRMGIDERVVDQQWVGANKGTKSFTAFQLIYFTMS